MEQTEQGDSVNSEARVVSEQELADMVKILRGARNWSQEQVAEISVLTDRTIQRVERGDASSFDTRRALARAFEAPDIDCFNNPLVRITPEQADGMAENFKKDHLFLKAEVGTGKSLVKLAQIARVDLIHSAAEMPRQAEEAFAALVDLWRDYRDTHDCYDEVGKLDIRDDLQGYLDELNQHGFSVRIADRPVALGHGESHRTACRTRMGYIVAFARGKEPTELIVAKAVEF